jgi:hypothetical protein
MGREMAVSDRCRYHRLATAKAARWTPAGRASTLSSTRAERCAGGLERWFDVAVREHLRHVAGAGGRLAAVGRGIDLNGHWRRGNARAREQAARRIRIAHEVADMVVEDPR